MSIFGGGAPKPTKVNRVQLNQSVLGYSLPVVMGKGKVQQSLLWLDGFQAKKIKVSGGKGIGGGKGGTEYLYSADLIAALCAGPIKSIGDVWSGQSWLSNSNTAESYTIANIADPVYTPVNNTALAEDWGVQVPSAYAGSYSDLGAGTPTALSGTDFVSFQRVAYGSTLTTGQYAIDPTNKYHFAQVDNGKTVQLKYSFALNIIKQQENDLVPGSKTIAVGSTFPFSQDDGVTYFTGPNNGVRFTKVTGTPTVAGTYSVTGSGPATYHFATADIGVEVQITYKIQNNSVVPQGTPSSLAFTAFTGAIGQSPWSLLTSSFPGAAVGYSGIAYVGYSPMSLGFGAQIQQNVFEVLTDDAYGGGIVDCNPVQCILQVLTNKQWGLGAGAVPFPVNAIDNGVGGTWGSKALGSARQVASTAWTWFASNNFFISPVIDRQETAASAIAPWLEAGNCAAFMSEGLLKLVPYGDTSTAANGATWVAPSAFAAAVDDSCFLKKSDGQDPVKISSSPWQDAYNTVQVQWDNRGSQYAPEITPEFDQAAINRYGSRIEDPQSWDFIHTLEAATFAASMRVKRNVYTRNTFEFNLPYSYSYLECMDVLYLTTSSVWAAGLNNLNLAITNLPVRITKIVDNPGEEGLTITCEDYPFGVHQPTLFNKSIAAGNVQQNMFVDPGDSEVVLFEATSRLTGFQGNQIWMGATGASKDWGSCNVHVSQDGSTYKQIGTIDTQARLGTLASGLSWSAGADPDTTGVLLVNLAENSPMLEAGTSADADAGNTLCYVDGEILAYSAAALVGQDQYQLDTYLRRGLMGSQSAFHPNASLFLRLDDAIFKFAYDPTWAGKTIYLKFQSVNAYGNAAQDLSTLTAITVVIPGTNPGTVDASSGLVMAADTTIGAGPLGWAPATTTT